MRHFKTPACALFMLLYFFLGSCHEGQEKIKEKELVADPTTMDSRIQQHIKDQLALVGDRHGSISDSLTIEFLPALKYYYGQHDHLPVWSSMQQWKPFAGELVQYLDHAASDGLFKEDYHYKDIIAVRASLEDTLNRPDAVLWARADLLFTNAFMHLIQDLKQGRLQPDSLEWKHNLVKQQSFFSVNLERLKKAVPLDSIIKFNQPSIKAYWLLKRDLTGFIDSMDTKRYTYVKYPYIAGNKNDSMTFINKLALRLNESGIYVSDESIDSMALVTAVKKYQHQMKMVADGKITASFIKKLNMTDVERYNRIVITLDRYKNMPVEMPGKYILVNLPSFTLQVWDTDTVAFTSRIICGKPATATPFITSAISDLVIFPTWTVPASIIKKEILPGLKKNPGYLARKGLDLYNNKGEMVDAYSVNWAKYSKGIPFKVQQGSGDNNALGVIKFNFNNPYDVYLHDTNQRSLFKNAVRALSHGCVRVQEWEKLARFIVRNDSLMANTGDTLKYNIDSISNWIARKERHRVEVRNKIPLFIRYFGCESINGKIKFYDDIYDEDKKMKERFFAHK